MTGAISVWVKLRFLLQYAGYYPIRGYDFYEYPFPCERMARANGRAILGL